MFERRAGRAPIGCDIAADIAGYSRLMGRDEEGTLAALRAIRRELSDPKIAEHKRPHRQDHRRWTANRIFQRRRCGALRGRGAARRWPNKCQYSAGPAHRVPHRHPSGRHRCRGRRHFRRRRQYRSTAGRARRSGRHMRQPGGARRSSRQARRRRSRIAGNSQSRTLPGRCTYSPPGSGPRQQRYRVAEPNRCRCRTSHQSRYCHSRT